MGRWDNRNASSDEEQRNLAQQDEWNKENNTNFDWRETPWNDHPKGCNCPKHEYIKEKIATRKLTQDNSPVAYKLCPDHYKAWYETQPEMYKRMKLWQKIIMKLALRFGWIKIIELKYAQSDLCMWCKFGSGGRGVKHDPLRPDMP